MDILTYQPISTTFKETLVQLVASMIPFAALHWVSFHFVMMKYPQWFLTEKARAWLLTALVAPMMILFSIPFLWTIPFNDYSLMQHPAIVPIAGFFLSYMMMDLIMGQFYYPRKITFLSGYVHHMVYSYIIVDAVQNGIGGAFIMLGIMDTPTWLLALGSILPHYRTNWGFGLSFFATRILFHIYFVYRLILMLPEWRFAGYMMLTFPMHLLWLRGWLRGMKKAKV